MWLRTDVHYVANQRTLKKNHGTILFFQCIVHSKFAQIHHKQKELNKITLKGNEALSCSIFSFN